MAVRNVMHNLSDGPTAIALGRIELSVRESLDRGAQAGRSLFDLVKEPFLLRFAQRAFKRKLSDGISRICHSHLLWHQSTGGGYGFKVSRVRNTPWKMQLERPAVSEPRLAEARQNAAPRGGFDFPIFLN
jgi:hypothetical protein